MDGDVADKQHVPEVSLMKVATGKALGFWFETKYDEYQSP